MEILPCVYKQVKLVPKGALMRADTPYPTGTTVRKEPRPADARMGGTKRGAILCFNHSARGGYNASVLIKTDGRWDIGVYTRP